ncbi:unnamed protein product [Orchesella dallaii]
MVQDRSDTDSSVNHILRDTTSSQLRSVHLIKYPSLATITLESFQERLKEDTFKIANENAVLIARRSKLKLPLQFPISIAHYRKLSDQCSIVVLMINDLRPQFIKQIQLTISPVYVPITRKDEDFYIFKTDRKNHKKLLLMQEYPNRIKFKMAVGYEPAQKSVVARTVCFFCEPGGNPRLVDIPLPGTPQSEEVEYFPDFVWDLNGKVLHVTMPNFYARVEADPPWKGINNAKRGHWKMLFETFLTVKFNFSYHMFASTRSDGTGGAGTGVLLRNGTWNGVVGDLVSGRADLGIVTAHTPKRIHYIDYVDALYDPGSLTFVTAQPTKIFSPAQLLWPFDIVVWMSVIASIGVCILVFFATTKIMDTWKFNSETIEWPLDRQSLFLLSTFMEQDSPVLPESNPLRCFVALWIFFTMLVTNMYRCKMATLLAFPSVGKVPETFDELAFSDYEVGYVRHGDSAYNTLAASTDPVYVKLVGEMTIFHGYGLECLEKVVKSNKYGCIAYDFSLVHVRERNMSDSDARKLRLAPVKTYNIWLGVSTEGKSIYRLNFGKWLGLTRQFHLLDIWDKIDLYWNVRKLKLDWWISTNQTDKMKFVEADSDDLTLKHIAGAFYILIFFLSISTLAFIYEIVVYYKSKMIHSVVFWYWSTKRKIKRYKSVIRWKW